MIAEKNIHYARTLLRIGYGVVACAAGVDKFILIITDWHKYLWSGWAQFLPLTPTHLLYGVGIIEFVVGLLILNPKTTRLGAYLVAAWFGIIIVNLCLQGIWFDIIVRDALLAGGAIALGLLAAIPTPSYKN